MMRTGYLGKEEFQNWCYTGVNAMLAFLCHSNRALDRYYRARNIIMSYKVYLFCQRSPYITEEEVDIYIHVLKEVIYIYMDSPKERTKIAALMESFKQVIKNNLRMNGVWI